MENVDIYMKAEMIAENYPGHELVIAFEALSPTMKYSDTPERLAAANAIIEELG